MKRKFKKFLFTGKLQSILEDSGKFILRLLFGLSLAVNHGWPTITSTLSGHADFPDPLGIGTEITMAMAGFAEFICALFVVAGLFTRISVIPILINFAVAFFIFHSGDPFGRKELAYLYLSSMPAIMLLGSRKYSLDYLLFRESKNPKR